MFLDAGLTVERVEIMFKPTRGLVQWARVQHCTPETIEKLQVMLQQAPQAVVDFFQPRCVGTPEADFDHSYVLILGKKDNLTWIGNSGSLS